MPQTIIKVFGKNKNIIIGALHFPPLLGYPDFPGFDVSLKNALADLDAFTTNGVNSVILENNYDLPHKILVEPGTITAMTYLSKKIKPKNKLPIGISTLWNDYKTSLSIAKTLNLKFIRISVFVDKVKTGCGIVKPVYKEAIKYRQQIKANDVLLFTDIHVKHAKLLSKYSLHQSAKLAIKNGSDALIITGPWTGKAPDFDELKKLRQAVGNFPIFIGSGADQNNIKTLLKYANGVIISTSLKTGTSIKGERNVKKYSQRIDPKKVKKFIRASK